MHICTRVHVHTHVCPHTHVQMHTWTHTGWLAQSGRPREAGDTIWPESSPQGPRGPTFKLRSEPEAHGPGAQCPGQGTDDGLKRREQVRLSSALWSAQARTDRTACGRAEDAAFDAAPGSVAQAPGNVLADAPAVTVFQLHGILRPSRGR